MKTRTADEAQLDETIMELLCQRGHTKTICPSEVARHIVGQDETQWRRLMKPIRARAIHLADDGALVIKRKGKVVDPHHFKGVYRLGLPLPHDEQKND